MIRSALFFDLDGTLVDPSVGIRSCMRHALAALGRACPPDNVLDSFIGPPLRRIFSTLLETDSPALVEEAVGLYRRRYADRCLEETHLYDGIRPMLDRARGAASAMFVATSKPTTFAQRIVEHFGLARYFDAVYGNALDGRFDDKADLVAHALGAEGLKPTGAIMIGDRAVDVAAARAHGMPAIGVLWGYGSRFELDEAGAFRLCGTPTELAECLSQTAGTAIGPADGSAAAR